MDLAGEALAIPDLQSSILVPSLSLESAMAILFDLTSPRVKRIHHQALMVARRAEILIERVGEHAVRHHRVTVIRSRPRPNHVRIIRSMIVAVACRRFRFMCACASVHAAVNTPNRFVSRPSSHIKIDRNIDAVILHALKTADRLPENDARARVLAGDIEYFLGRADLIGGKDR